MSLFSVGILLVLTSLFVELQSKESFCEKLPHLSNSEVHLQALTFNSTSREYWLIESRYLYRIPEDFLDTAADQLYLYNRNDAQPRELSSNPWNVYKYLQLVETRKRDLVWFTILNRTYRFYQFNDTWYVTQASTGPECDSFTDRFIPWDLTTTVNSKGKEEVLMGLTAAGKVRRVIFTPLTMNVLSTKDDCNTVQFNFPGEDGAFFKPIPPQTPFIYLETDENRKTATFTASSASSKTNYDNDLFALPPAAISTPTKLYLFSLHLRRVYILNSQDLTAALEGQTPVSFSVNSKSWSQFFICPNASTTETSTEPTQAEYLALLGDLYPEESFNWYEWFDDYLQEISTTLLVSILFISFLLMVYSHDGLAYFRKRRKKKRKIATESERKPSSETATSKPEKRKDKSKTSQTSSFHSPRLSKRVPNKKGKPTSLKKATHSKKLAIEKTHPLRATSSKVSKFPLVKS